MSDNPLAEVFGFPTNNYSEMAQRYRKGKLCPFNNKVPNCTKDKALDPLGVCSILDDAGNPTIACPIRFREKWIIAEHAASFFFPPNASWTSLTEVRLKDANGQSAGNVDIVLVSYDAQGRLTDFGSLEIQAVYISGNVRNPFAYYMEDAINRADMRWDGPNYPRADYLSSSRKRLAPQMLYKGGIFNEWKKKQAVVLHRSFYETLPDLPQIDKIDAEVAWLLYDLVLTPDNRFELSHYRTIYTAFEPALLKVTKAPAGRMDEFINLLQSKLNNCLSPPDSPTLQEMLTGRD
jgi:hypothetical protein